MTQESTKKRVGFRHHAPEAREVFLAGSFNAWDPATHPLQRDKNGVWKRTVSLSPGRHEYRFVVDGQWQDDPTCEESCDNGFGDQNSVIRV